MGLAFRFFLLLVVVVAFDIVSGSISIGVFVFSIAIFILIVMIFSSSTSFIFVVPFCLHAHNRLHQHLHLNLRHATPSTSPSISAWAEKGNAARTRRRSDTTEPVDEYRTTMKIMAIDGGNAYAQMFIARSADMTTMAVIPMGLTQIRITSAS